MQRVVVVLFLAACLGCGGSPSSPSQPSSGTPPATSAATEWNVTQRFVSVTGPDNCWVREQRERLTGSVFTNLPTTITRSDAAIKLESGFFQVNYDGTFSGRDFSAGGRAPLSGGGRTCADGSTFQQMPGTSALSGRFSDDDRLLTAAEVNSYSLLSGEPVVYTWEWQATRRN